MLARVEPHHVLGHLATLHGGDRGQRQLARQVTRCVDVVDVALAVLVDRDVATVGDDAGGIEAQLVGVGDGADREQGMRPGDDAPVVATDRDDVAGALDAHGPGTLQQLHAPSEEVLLQHGGDLGVLLGEHLLAADDERHVAAEAREHVHELHPGDAGADHDEVLGELGRRVGLARREDALAVRLGEVGDAGPAAGREQDGVGGQLGEARGRLDDDLVRALQLAGTPKDPHSLALEQGQDGGLEAILDALVAHAQRLEVELGAHLGEPHGLGPAGLGHGTAGGDHRLGRDAVPQVSRPADDVPLDERHLGSLAGPVGGGGVPGGPPADDHEVGRHACRGYRRPSGRPVTGWGDAPRRPRAARR